MTDKSCVCAITFCFEWQSTGCVISVGNYKGMLMMDRNSGRFSLLGEGAFVAL